MLPRILLAQNAYSPQARSSELGCQRVQNVIDVVQVISLNLPCDVRIVGDRFCSRCVVRGFGLYNPVSLKLYRTKVLAVARYWCLMRAWMQNRDVTVPPVFLESN